MPYKDLDIKDILQLKKSPCDVFMFLPSGKQVIICKQDNLVNKTLLDKYSKNEKVEIKVKSSDYPRVIQQGLENKAFIIKESLKDKQFINRTKRLKIEMASFAISRAMVGILGISETILDLADDTFGSVIHTLDKIPSLKTILYDLELKGDYFVKKGLIMNYICIDIISKTKWNADHVRKNFSMACLLHDYTINDKRYLKNFDEKEAKGIEGQKKWQRFLSHSEKEAKTLSEHHEIPVEVINLIRYHHINLDGTGFPENKVNDLTFFSQVFNVSHSLAIEILEEGPTKKTVAGYFYQLSQNIKEQYKHILGPFSYIM